MKINSYRVIAECVERGINGGWARAHKHTNKPTENQVKEQLDHYIMMELCDYIDFDKNQTELNIKEDE